MCLSPRYIHVHSLYTHPALSVDGIFVPCRECEACRDARKSMWEDRLCLEVEQWYKNGGIGLMLTFTYNDDCLPHYYRDGSSVVCFSSSDINAFLNRVKVRSARMFGPDFYRYFVCSEYGKNTKRPHYHVDFLIKDPSKYVEFVEMCRECWTWLYVTDKKGHKRPAAPLGFMFPKYDGKHYVDDHGKPKDPRFRSKKAGAKYACKYICKDLDYYALDDVKMFENNIDFKDKKPKSWKSNNLGFSAISAIVEKGNKEDIQKLLSLGVWCSIANKYVKLWPSAISRLMYNNVWNGRRSSLTNKKIYDRELSSFGREYLWFAFKARLERTALKMYQRAILSHSSNALKKFCLTSSSFFTCSNFKNYAFWHCFLKQLNVVQLASRFRALDYDIDAFFDVDNWRTFYLLQHDSVTLSSCDYFFEATHEDVARLLPYLVRYKHFEELYIRLSITLERMSLDAYKSRGEAIQRAKLASGIYSFPLDLC